MSNLKSMNKLVLAKKELEDLNMDVADEFYWTKLDEVVRLMKTESFRDRIVPGLQKKYDVTETDCKFKIKKAKGEHYIIYTPHTGDCYCSKNKQKYTVPLRTFNSFLIRHLDLIRSELKIKKPK